MLFCFVLACRCGHAKVAGLDDEVCQPGFEPSHELHTLDIMDIGYHPGCHMRLDVMTRFTGQL